MLDKTEMIWTLDITSLVIARQIDNQVIYKYWPHNIMYITRLIYARDLYFFKLIHQTNYDK